MDNSENSARKRCNPAKDRTVADTYEKREASTQDSTIAKAKKLWYEAERWRQNNPYVWSYIVQLCLKETESKRRFGMKWAIEETRKKDLVTDDGERCGISNSYSPVFARMLISEHPETRPYIVLHRSVVDKLMV